MKEKIIVGTVLAVTAFFVLFWAQTFALMFTISKSNNVGKFNLSPERIAKDLDGRNVNLLLNQVWPFDLTQNINVTVTGKKQLDEYVAVVVDVKANAPVQQEAASSIKEGSTKDPPRSAPKLPSRLNLSGRMKLTYELIDNEWYLLTVENLTLKAVGVD